MKIIEVDDELYQYIASKTENIGEQASDILRRLLGFSQDANDQTPSEQPVDTKASDNPPDEEIEVVIPAEEAKNESQIDAQDVDVKTTTVKEQQAKHALLNGDEQDAESATEENVGEQKAQQPEVEESKEPALTEDVPVKDAGQTAKSAARTANRKVKARKKAQVSKTPSDEDLIAPVTGLELPLIVECNNVVGRFLYILEALEQKHQQDFAKVLQVQGKGRLYFATSELELSEAGSNTNPKQIGQSTYWVMTNSNTNRKKQMLSEVLKNLGYAADDIETLAAKL